MRKWRIAVFAVVAVLVAGGVFWLRRLADLAHIGTGYAAEQVCSCLFVSSRPLDSCRRDLDPLARKLVKLGLGTNEVTARARGLAEARARYEAGFGCTLIE